MNRRTLHDWRWLVLTVLVMVGMIATANFLLRRELPFEWAQRENQVVIARLDTTSLAYWHGMRAGDRVLEFHGRNVTSVAVVDWELMKIQPRERVHIALERGPYRYNIDVIADQPFPWGYFLLDRLTGFALLALGFLVWWTGAYDATVRVFFRCTIIGGLAVLLYGYESFFGISWLASLYAAAWLFFYALLPAAIADFVFCFPRRAELKSVRNLRATIFYAPAIAMFVGLSLCYFAADKTQNVAWIERYDVMFRRVFGAVLVFYVTLAFLRLVYISVKPASPWEKSRNRWLLLCTLLGLAPFVLLHKLPALWGLPPLLPRGAAISFVLIAPLGWGMAAASFQLLKVEWTLSRTMIYFVTAGIVLYASGSIVVAGRGYVERSDWFSLLWIILIAAGLILLAGLSLIDRIKMLVDRLYFADWFDVQKAVERLSAGLSGCFLERDVAAILTSELPAMLRLEKATLLLQNPHGAWRSLPPFSIDKPDLPDQSEDLQTFPADHSLYQHHYRAALPVHFQNQWHGWLLLGTKYSGAPYSERDRRLLRTLSGVSGMAIANAELNRQLLEQERRAAAADLAGGIAHEINNALSPLMGQSQLIEFAAQSHPEQLPTQTVAPAARIITDMCRRIKRIADSLNHLAKPAPSAIKPVALNLIVEETLAIMTETAGRIKHFHENDPESPFILRKILDPNLPFCRGDFDQLSQVFINLILNAADAMQPMGRGVLTVGTRIFPEQQSIIGFVEDTGPGIPQELYEKVFQPYFTTKPEGQGTGLGLTMVRSIIEMHGGKLQIISKSGNGTRIEFSLPLSEATAH